MTLKDSIEQILATANEDLKMAKAPEMVVLRAVLDTIKSCGEHYSGITDLEEPNPTRKEVK